MKRPNLLFIFTDEQRADTLAAYGNARIAALNLQRLAARSTVFDRAYVTQPVCTPSRATLLTGLYPHAAGCTANNVPLPVDLPCLPEMLPPGRYATAYHGKWHLGDEVFPQHGFAEWISIEDMYRRFYGPGRDPRTRSGYHGWLRANGWRPKEGEFFTRPETARLPEMFSKPSFLARQARRFLYDAPRPFVLFVNFLEPHMPFFGPRDGQYAPADVLLPGNFDHPRGPDQPLKARLLARHFEHRGHSGLPLRTEADWRRLIANYWGLCSLVDTHVGSILDAMDDCRLWDDTLVVYTSDHGDMMGSHRLIGKCVMYEEAVRAPLMVHLPGQNSSRRVAEPVSQVDLAPTLLDLMGEPIRPHLQGRSLRPVLEGAAQPTADVFIEWNGADCDLKRLLDPSEPFPDYLRDLASVEEARAALADPIRSVVTPAGWKFSCSQRGEHELYDLNADPLETANLARQPGSAGVMKQLAGRIAAWQERTGDALRLARV